MSIVGGSAAPHTAELSNRKRPVGQRAAYGTEPVPLVSAPSTRASKQRVRPRAALHPVQKAGLRGEHSQALRRRKARSASLTPLHLCRPGGISATARLKQPRAPMRKAGSTTRLVHRGDVLATGSPVRPTIDSVVDPKGERDVCRSTSRRGRSFPRTTCEPHAGRQGPSRTMVGRRAPYGALLRFPRPRRQREETAKHHLAGATAAI
jgi:hypothetical protein